MSNSDVGGNGPSAKFGPDISRVGQIIAFGSDASNLVSHDTNRHGDVFIRDLRRRSTTRVSISSSGRQGNATSSDPAVSARGRYVTYVSKASNLVPGDTNHVADMFVWDRADHRTQRVSIGRGGVEGNGETTYRGTISADGRLAVFRSAATNLVNHDTNGKLDLFVRDLRAHSTKRVPVSSNAAQPNGSSGEPVISNDGRLLAFQSGASNLAPGDTNGVYDIYVHNLVTGKTERLSQNADGDIGDAPSVNPAISADGRYVAFGSVATNLVPQDTNGREDIFVIDRKLDTINRVSIGPGGDEGNGRSTHAAISSDGRYVAYASRASNLAPADGDHVLGLFVRDRSTGTTRVVSSPGPGRHANGPSLHPAISGSGAIIAYASQASNLVDDDTNKTADAFACVRGVSP